MAHKHAKHNVTVCWSQKEQPKPSKLALTDPFDIARSGGKPTDNAEETRDAD